MSNPFITLPQIPRPDPFKVFLAKVAGERIDIKDGNTRLVAYFFRDVMYVTECYSIT